jgi:carbon-monoxide dehydrogenase medium subunit
VFPKQFEYFAPETLKQALDLIRKHRKEGKILAVGQSLIPLMKLRLASPRYLIDINNIKGLSYIKEASGAIRIGALTRHADVEHSSLLKKKLPILPETAAEIADQQVRNLGTICGSMCHADPAGDWGPSMLSLDAKLVLRDSHTRVIDSKDFFKSTFQTALRPTELLTEIRIPIPKAHRVGQAYLKFERKAGDFAIVGVAVNLSLNPKKEIVNVGISLCSMAEVPFRASAAEKVLLNRQPTTRLIEEAARAASNMSKPWSDLRGSAEYKKEMAFVFTSRALTKALERAGVKL